MRETRQLTAITAGQMPFGGAYLFFDQVKIVEQPFGSGRDTAVYIDRIAEQIAAAQTKLIAKAFTKLSAISTKKQSKQTKKLPVQAPKGNNSSLHAFECVAISGHGDFLVEAALAACGWDGERIRLQELLGSELSRCAPAYAIATLASEELSED